MIRKLSAIGNSRWLAIMLHVAGWTLFLTLPYLLRSSGVNAPRRPRLMPPPESDINPFGRMSYEPLLFNVLMIPLFYLNVSYLVPRFLLKRKYLQFLLIQVAIMVILHFAGNFVRSIMAPEFPRMRMGVPIYIYILITSFAVCYCLIRQNMENEKKQKEKENENLKSELLFLRWQISPHFMFNALNNMVALSRVKSDKLESMLIRLSTLMRYMLYDTDERKVSINTEIEYLHSYIDLQSIRFGDEVRLIRDIRVEDNVNVLIEPMLLIPFVENAFKHGTGTVAQPFIHLIMDVSQESLSFTIRNSYKPGASDTGDQTHGIGLANVRRRLNLLFAEKFTLDVQKDDTWFLVTLKIRFE